METLQNFVRVDYDLSKTRSARPVGSPHQDLETTFGDPAMLAKEAIERVAEHADVSARVVPISLIGIGRCGPIQHPHRAVGHLVRPDGRTGRRTREQRQRLDGGQRVSHISSLGPTKAM